jgi:hypothetical protein
MTADLVGQRLTDAEAVIERGLATFVEVGAALMSIRDERLYRVEYGTFEDYCRERWGMTRRHANRLVEAAEITVALGPIGPTTESQARELTGLPPEIAAEVMDLAAESGKVTAASIRDARETIQPTKPAEWSCHCGAAFKTAHTHCDTCGDHYPEPGYCTAHNVAVNTESGEILDGPTPLPEVPSQWRADAADRFHRLAKVNLIIRDHMDSLADACAHGSDLERSTWSGIAVALADRASDLAALVNRPVTLRRVK